MYNRTTQLGVYLELIMYKEKWSQEELAKRCGVSQATISRIIRGKFKECKRFVACACKNAPQYFEPRFSKNMAYHSFRKLEIDTRSLPKEDIDRIIDQLIDSETSA